MSDIEPSRFSYVVSPERTYWVSTIDYRNPCAPSFDCIESGIRDISRVQDGKTYGYKEIPFTLCQHNIWPLPEGHAAVVQSLKDGIEPDAVWDYLREAWKGSAK